MTPGEKPRRTTGDGAESTGVVAPGSRERIHKVIAHSGYTSRRHAEILISRGRVTVDGREAGIGERVDPETAKIEIDGIPLPVRPDLEYHLLYKPVDVVSTAADPHGRRTVVDEVDADTRVYPVGRLDADSEGLLILTNDGDLTHRLTHPSFGVTKTYTVLVEGSVDPAIANRLVSGVTLDDGPAAAVAAKVLDKRPDRSLVEVVMTEGRNREVRRMFDVVGHPVTRLIRTAIGNLRDPQLTPGATRRLTLEEVRALYAEAGDPCEDRPLPDDRPSG